MRIKDPSFITLHKYDKMQEWNKYNAKTLWHIFNYFEQCELGYNCFM